MWQASQTYIRRSDGFFFISTAHDSLKNYYQTNFALMQHHKYSLTELENMMRWERDIYVTLLSNYIEKENEKNRNSQQANKRVRHG